MRFILFFTFSSGPCFFLSCPVSVDEFRSWFIDLWNHSIIPYLQEGAKDGVKVRGHHLKITFVIDGIRLSAQQLFVARAIKLFEGYMPSLLTIYQNQSFKCN